MQFAERLSTVGPYLFFDLDQKAAKARARGVDVINLGIGDPDLPTPLPIVAALAEAASNPATHRYPDYQGSERFRAAVAGFYARRFGVSLDPKSEVLALIGSKEGISHLTWAAAGPGDVVLVPEPAYPVYAVQARLAGATTHPMPLRAERGFLPDLDAVPDDVWRRAKLLWLNYPNNPTGAVADLGFWREAVAACRGHDVLLASDQAYSEIGFDGYRAPSVLEVPGAKEIAVEFFSLSKPYRMTGWRIAAAVGWSEAIAALAVVKTNTDSGQFTAVQMAGVRALEPDLDPAVEEGLQVYQRRRDRAVEALRRAGFRPPVPRATFYLWVPTPGGRSATETAAEVLDKVGVVITPGSAYGAAGEGFVRLSLTAADERLDEAFRRIASLKLS